MLSKNYRMKKNSQFDYIFRNGKTLKNRNVLIFYSKSNSINPKIGVVVSKKIGNSVTRNHVKRVLREVIHKHIPILNNKYNYIFVARQGIETLKYDEIDEIISKMIENNGLNV